MTGLDLIIIILVLSGSLLGYYRGFVGSLGDIIGIAAGITVASLIYKGSVKLFRQFDITGVAVEVVLFLFCALFFILLFMLLIESLKKRIDLKHVVDRIAGIPVGFLEGIIFSGMLCFIMSASFNPAMEVERSKLAKRIVRRMPSIYEKTDRAGIVLPKMIYLPDNYLYEFNPGKREIQFLNTNFSQFEGFTCMECGGKVLFEGYFPRVGAAFVPKVTCTDCERTSDGCQTYEGFHKLYGKCPIDLANEGMRFDCGRWPNRILISPKGTCPVDNKSMELWFWKPPEKY